MEDRLVLRIRALLIALKLVKFPELGVYLLMCVSIG